MTRRAGSWRVFRSARVVSIRTESHLNQVSIVSPSYGNGTLAAPRLVSISDDGSYAFFTSATGSTPQALNNVCLHEKEKVNARPLCAEHLRVSRRSGASDLNTAKTAMRCWAAAPCCCSGRARRVTECVLQDGRSAGGSGHRHPGGLRVYARIDGGFPAPASSSCQGEACQGALDAALGTGPGELRVLRSG